VARLVPRIKAHVPLPVGVGFGIRDAASAVAVARVSDAVVIGSRIIQLIEQAPRERVVPVASAFVREIRQALDEIATPMATPKE
jgi:tryptophan synthase alpha chain